MSVHLHGLATRSLCSVPDVLRQIIGIQCRLAKQVVPSKSLTLHLTDKTTETRLWELLLTTSPSLTAVPHDLGDGCQGHGDVNYMVTCHVHSASTLNMLWH